MIDNETHTLNPALYVVETNKQSLYMHTDEINIYVTRLISDDNGDDDSYNIVIIYCNQ